MHFEILYRLKNEYYKKATAIRWPDENECVFLGFFGFCKRRKIFLYPPVINTEELVGSGSHVDIIRLSLRPLFIHEGINGIVSGGALDEPVHDLKEGLPQARRPFF